MKVVPLSTIVAPYGGSAFIDMMVVRDPEDAPASYPFAVCIKDSSGRVVYSTSFAYDSTDDVVVKSIEVSSLPADGVYEMDIYNWTDCSPPSNVLTFKYRIHWLSSSRHDLMLGVGWNLNTVTRAFMMYVYNGKLFWFYGMNVSGMPAPVGVPVYLEITDGDGNAFVGSFIAYSPGESTVNPNMEIPFMAVFRIIYEQPIDDSIYRALTGLAGFAKGAYIRRVDDYTVELGIVKMEPGLDPLTAALIILAIIGAVAIAYMWYDKSVKEIQLESKKLEKIDPLVQIQKEMYSQYMAEAKQCGKDENCIRLVQYKYFGPLQMINGTIGYVVSVQSSGSRPCDGLNLGGVCVPWWVVAVAIFLAGLLVIAAVK